MFLSLVDTPDTRCLYVSRRNVFIAVNLFAFIPFTVSAGYFGIILFTRNFPTLGFLIFSFHFLCNLFSPTRDL